MSMIDGLTAAQRNTTGPLTKRILDERKHPNHSPSEPTRVVYKFATGEPIPPGATYLSTVAQTHVQIPSGSWTPCWLVWHYFLIEVDPKEST